MVTFFDGLFPVSCTNLHNFHHFIFSLPEHVNSELERFFSKSFHDKRRTLSEPSLAKDGIHGFSMAIIGPFETVVIIDELQWILSTGFLQSDLDVK